MQALLQAMDQYGWVAVLFVVIILNGGRITDWFAKNFFPAWAERRKHRLELQRQEIARREKEQLDIILVLKDMILSYKTELDDAKLERKQLHNIILDLVGKYERMAAQTIEAYRDVSDRIDILARAIVNGQYTRTERDGEEPPRPGGTDTQG